MTYEMISGALLMACFVVGLFFLKFWQKTHDRLFAMFAAAFWILSLERFVLGSLGTDNEADIRIYFLRLLAFVLILIAIIDKNREPKRKK